MSAFSSARPSVPLRRLVAVLLVALSWSGVLVAPAAADVRPDELSSAEERVVLGLIDDVCGDTWCEGDHAMRFRRFTCHRTRGCVLRVHLAPWSQQPLRWHTRSARVQGFTRFRDMVATAPDGHRSLQPSFYDAVGAAVRAMAATVPVDGPVRPGAQ